MRKNKKNKNNNDQLAKVKNQLSLIAHIISENLSILNFREKVKYSTKVSHTKVSGKKVSDKAQENNIL
jgi:hypothetical protein